MFVRIAASSKTTLDQTFWLFNSQGFIVLIILICGWESYEGFLTNQPDCMQNVVMQTWFTVDRLYWKPPSELSVSQLCNVLRYLIQILCERISHIHGIRSSWNDHEYNKKHAVHSGRCSLPSEWPLLHFVVMRMLSWWWGSSVRVGHLDVRHGRSGFHSYWISTLCA